MLQSAAIGAARVLASRGDVARARAIVERELRAGIVIPREQSRAELLLADLATRNKR